MNSRGSCRSERLARRRIGSWRSNLRPLPGSSRRATLELRTGTVSRGGRERRPVTGVRSVWPDKFVAVSRRTRRSTWRTSTERTLRSESWRPSSAFTATPSRRYSTPRASHAESEGSRRSFSRRSSPPISPAHCAATIGSALCFDPGTVALMLRRAGVPSGLVQGGRDCHRADGSARPTPRPGLIRIGLAMRDVPGRPHQLSNCPDRPTGIPGPMPT